MLAVGAGILVARHLKTPEELSEVDFRDMGNVESRLTHAFDVTAAVERAKIGVDRVLALVPAAARGRGEVRAVQCHRDPQHISPA